MNYPSMLTGGALEYWRAAAYTHIVVLAARHSWDVDALIDATCARFEAQHAPEVQP